MATSPFDHWKHPLINAFAFLLPMKLAAAYACAFPLLALWFHRAWVRRSFSPLSRVPLLHPFLLFCLIGGISGLFGLHPFKSIAGLSGMACASLAVVIVHEVVSERGVQCGRSLVYGQGVAAAYSVLAAMFPQLPRLFLGDVTEAGQLALTSIFALGLCWSSLPSLSLKRGLALLQLGMLVLLTLVALGFSRSFGVPLAATTVAATAVALLVAFAWHHHRHLSRWLILSLIIVPLLFANLILNLKRGPWVGVFVGLTVLLWIHARRFVAPFVLASVVAATFIGPVRSRIEQSLDHFFISGGRSEIWDVGTELVTRYPLGIGFKNSPVLREFSREIPPELKHFHNNPLNIAVETGWIGLSVFLWWIVTLVQQTVFRTAQGGSMLGMHGIGCAILSWQIAGIVEYNVGDKEVMLVVFLLVGIASALQPRPVELRAHSLRE